MTTPWGKANKDFSKECAEYCAVKIDKEDNNINMSKDIKEIIDAVEGLPIWDQKMRVSLRGKRVIEAINNLKIEKIND